MTTGGFYQRDYNIINFEPRSLSVKASIAREPSLPTISSIPNQNFNKNFSTLSLGHNFAPKNSYNFKNATINEMKEKKTYDPLLESKINNNYRYENKNPQPTLLNASRLNYDFISFAKKKDNETFDSIKGQDPKATYKKSAISEFLHLGRVTNPNINVNYQNVYGKDTSSFKIRDGMGCQYLDSKKTYGDIADCFKRSGK